MKNLFISSFCTSYLLVPISKVLQEILENETLQLILGQNLDPNLKIKISCDKTTFNAWMRKK